MPNFRFQLNAPPSEIPACSTILNGVATRYRVDSYRTTLSVKAVARGAAMYVTPQGRHLVTQDTFLVLNEGQEYSLDFQWPAPTETICPFFQPGFLEHVSYCFTAPNAKQLDEIEPHVRHTRFYERLYPRTGRVGLLLNQLEGGVHAGQATDSWLEDRLYELAGALVEFNGEVARDIQDIRALRSATKVELYRRLHRGRDYLSSCYTEPISIAAVARVAGLSPAHFHRQFKALFRQTPMQFLQDRRLSAARRMLLTTDESVTAICFSVGLESLGSFSSLFQRRFGCSPGLYRRMHQSRRKKQS